MAIGVVARSLIAQLPLFVQILPTVLSGILTFAAAVYLAVRNSKFEHRRWLRQERHKVYSEFLAIANVGVGDLRALLEKEKVRKVVDAEFVERAQQTSVDLQQLLGNITLLGPRRVVQAATNVVWGLNWPQLDDIDANIVLEQLAEPYRHHEAVRLGGQGVLKRLENAENALAEFQRVAVEEVQGERTGR
jgi:hypothetical protein